ncbi:MAG TPA: type II 3-dehydroquinate dehydratase [Flavobacteriales bacterium]|nr:type II 3-dehydroquinate dehydratase [Flavobacteriales bacterium]
MKIAIINGPNLNLLGQREPAIYGSLSLDGIMDKLRNDFPGVEFEHYQSNLEGELINKVQEIGFVNAGNTAGIVINPGGFSHTSVALADAIAVCKIPVVEVHLSNIYARESYRHSSITGSKCVGVISGFGYSSYWMAVSYVLGKG